MSDNKLSEKVNGEVCTVCNIVAKQKCSGCQVVFYCSREHQISDWKSHSKNCPVFKLVEDSTIGKRYVATRKIKVDEIVLFEEKPLLVTPMDGNHCLNCYNKMRDEGCKKPCKTCGWLLCCNCTSHGPECELTIKYRKSKVIVNETTDPIYYAIMVLRALVLRENNPEAYQRFLALDDHRVAKSMKSTGPELGRRVKEFLEIDHVDEGEISKIIDIVEVKCCFVTNPPYRAVFDKASYFEHNCRPNCFKNFNNEGAIVIRAATTITKGDPITISYMHSLNTTECRRWTLHSTYVDCLCERCKDPTEFGTMVNALKCIKQGCTGYLLPPSFLVREDETISNWVCNKCNSIIPSALLRDILNEIVGTFPKFGEFGLPCYDDCKRFIENYQEKFLHKNYILIFKAKMYMAIAFHNETRNEEPVTNELLNEHITLCKELTTLVKILSPAEYNARGAIQFMQFLSMDALLHRQPLTRNELSRRFNYTLMANFITGVYLADTVIRWITNALCIRYAENNFYPEECMDVLAEAHRLLVYEPIGRYGWAMLPEVTKRFGRMRFGALQFQLLMEQMSLDDDQATIVMI